MSGKYRTAFVLGPPGSGKGTQCERISADLKWLHLSAGELLREEQARPGSTEGAMITQHMKNGTIVPVEVTCGLIERAMVAAPRQTPGFLIDGFPRNEDNMQGWNRAMGDKADVVLVLFLDCQDEVCKKRILSRGQGRVDDNEESLNKRLVTYRSQTMPIVNHYDKAGLVVKVDAGAAPDVVFEKVREAFAKLK